MGFWVYPEPGIAVASTRILEQMEREQQGKAPPAPPPPDPALIAKRYPEDRFPGPAAWIDGDWKLLKDEPRGASVMHRLFDLSRDAQEKTDLAGGEGARAARMKAALEAWQKSVAASLNGADYR
jgi:hypothetical protein